MNNWSEYIQNIEYLEKSRMQIMDPDMPGLMCRRIGLHNGMKILEVGCGTGIFSGYLSGELSDCSFTGIDTDSRFIGYASEHIPKDKNSWTYLVGNALNLPFNDASFDSVISHTFLTAVPDYYGAMREMIRVCKPGGTVASVTCAGFDRIGVRSGNYPAGEDWVAEYNRLRGKAERLYAQMDSRFSGHAGIAEDAVPSLFTEMGLGKVSVYPQGYFFSLSNAALTEGEKIRFTVLDCEAETKRFETAFSVCGSRCGMSEEEKDRYIQLLRMRKESLLRLINEGENRIWNWMTNLNLLVVGIKECAASEESYGTEFEKSRYKSAAPEDTVRQIREILDKCGIDVTENWNSSGIESARSLRVTISGTNTGQNGKGSTEMYARASGYAEFMERLQTGFLFQHDTGIPLITPDAVSKTKEELSAGAGELLTVSLKAIRDKTSPYPFIPLDIMAELEHFSWAEEDNAFSCVPFIRNDTGSAEYLPECIYRSFYFTNGSCAGNTREEALTQGLSEIMERYASVRIICEKLTPPVIPETAYKDLPVVRDLIEEIRRYAGMQLRIMDASLGIGLPVVCAVLTDTENGRMLMRFGSHPRFETALERTLTELLQGRSMNLGKDAPLFDFKEDNTVSGYINLFNFLKSSCGFPPSDVFRSAPSWEYRGFDCAPADIPGQYRYLLDKYKALGWNIYIRDSSFTGFPSYHILVPGTSMIFNFGKYRILEKKLLSECRSTLRNPSHSSPEERRKLELLLKYKRGMILENTFGFLAGLPFSPEIMGARLDAGIYLAFLKLAENNRHDAAEILRPYGYVCSGLRVLTMYADAADAGKDFAETEEILSAVYGHEAVLQASKAISDPLSFLPSLPCPDCDVCRYRDVCMMDTFRGIAGKINRVFCADRPIM